MPPKTRKAKEEKLTDEEVAEEIEESKPTALPQNDEGYDRKFVVSKAGSLANSKVVLLRHPKEGCALFRISNDVFDEVLTVNDGHRSWFYGDSVIENGSIHFFAPYNPLFVIIPYLQSKKEKFLEIDEILKDEKFEEIKELAENQKILENLEKVADVKEAIDTKVYRLNREKLMKWMEKVFGILKEKLRSEVHKSLLDCDDAFDRYVFTFLSDFLSPETASSVKEHLGIKEAAVSENIDMSMKRKVIDEDDEVPKPVVKKARESIVAKQLLVASKGTKSISSFFTKK